MIHPLAEGTQVKAQIQKCKCSGGGTQDTFSRIIKVYTTPTGIYYQLQTGITVKSTNILEVIK